MVLLAVAVLLVVLWPFAHYQNNHIVVSEFDISHDKVDSLRIVQLSDLHGKQFGKDNEELFEKVVELEPDLIVATGDMVSRSDKNLIEVVDFLAALNERAPAIYVFGNHEYGLHSFEGFRQKLQERDIIVLENEIYSLNINGNTVNILGFEGRTQRVTNASRMSTGYVSRLFSELGKRSGLKIVLSHHPGNYALADDNSFNQYDFDLMFSGHAHGGQWNLPFVGGVFTPSEGFMPQYYRGFYDDRLIVSAGLGNSRIPLRLFNYPEIVVVNVSMSY